MGWFNQALEGLEKLQQSKQEKTKLLVGSVADREGIEARASAFNLDVLRW